MLGSNDGDTSFTEVQFEASIDALMIAGVSTSSAFISSSSGQAIPFVIGFSLATNLPIWANSYLPASYSNSLLTSIQQLEVNDGGGKLVILFSESSNVQPPVIACLNTLDGTISYSLVESTATSFISSSGNSVMDSTGLITYASSEAHGSFKFMQMLPDTLNPSTPSFQVALSLNGMLSTFHTVDYLSFVGSGWIVDPNTGLSRASFFIFSPSKNEIQIFGSNLNQKTQELFLENQNIHFCQKDASNSDLLLGILDSSTGVSTSQFIYPATSTDQNCEKAFGFGSTQVFYISKSDGTFVVLSIDYSLGTYSAAPLTSISSPQNILSGVYIASPSTSYYVGSLYQLQDSSYPQTYSTKTAYLFSFVPDSTCLTYSPVYLSPTPITLSNSFLFEQILLDPLLLQTLSLTFIASNSSMNEVISSQIVGQGTLAEQFCFLDASIHLFSPTISNYTYILAYPMMLIQLSSFFFDLQCDDLVTTYTVSLASHANIPSFITFNDSALTLSVQTSNSNFISVYEIHYSATITDGLTKSVIFYLNVDSPCGNQRILGQNITETFIYNIDDPVFTYTIPANNLSLGPCTTVLYSITTWPLMTPLDSSLVTFDSVSRALAIYSADSLKIGTYTFQFIAKLDKSQYQISKKLYLTIENSCQYSQVTQTCKQFWLDRYVPSYYDTSIFLDSFYIYFVDNCFTQNQTTCPEVRMKWLDAITLQPPTYSYFSIAANGALRISADSSANGVYNLIVVGYTSNSQANFSTTIEFQTCSMTYQAQPWPQMNFYYVVGDPIIDFQITGWNPVMNNYCGNYFYAFYKLYSGLTISDNVNNETPMGHYYTTDLTQVGLIKTELVLTWGLNAHKEGINLEITVVHPCTIAELTPPIIPDLAYNLRDPQMKINLGTFASNYSVLNCDNITYYLTSQNNSSIDSSLFSFDNTTQSLFIQSSDYLKAGIYQFVYIGELGQFKNQSTSFNIQVLDLCLTSFITPPSDLIINYTIPDPKSTTTIGAFTLAQSYCGAITYTCTNIDGSPINSDLLTFTPATRKLSVYSSDNYQNGTYQLSIVGTLPAPYNSLSATLHVSINVNVSCSMTNITMSPAVSMNYVVGDNAQTQVFSPWTESMGVCGAFTYSVKLATGASIPAFMTFNPVTLELTFSTLSVSFAGSYSLVFFGILEATSSSLPFTVIVNNPCPTAIIQAPSNPSNIINQLNVADTITIGSFSSTLNSSICGAFTYVVTKNGSSITSSPFTFTSASMSFNIYTTSSSKIGTYIIIIKAYQGSYSSNSQSITFKVQIIDQCPQASINVPTILDPSPYYIWNSTMTISIGQVSSNMSTAICGALIYSAKQNGSALTTPLFNFQSTSNILSLSVYSTNAVNAQIYAISITVFSSLYPSNSKTISFLVTIIDPCPTALITTPLMLPIYNYSILNSTLVIQLGNFVSSESDSKCGSFIYQMTENNSPLPTPPFTFDSNAMTLSIFKASGVPYSLSNMKLIGYQGTYSLNQQMILFQVAIEDICRYALITPSSIPNTTYHLLADSIINVPFDQFTSNSSFCGSYTYSTRLTNGNPLDSSFAIFDPLLRTFSVNTVDLGKIGSYEIIVIGALPSPYPSANFTFTLKLDCYNDKILIPAPQSFDYLITSSALSAILPIFAKTPSCNYAFQYQLTFSNGSTAPDFVTFNQDSLLMTLKTSDNSKFGTYSLILRATLIGDPSMHQKYQYITLNLSPNYFQMGELPYFEPKLSDQSLILGSSLSYTLPTVIDKNPGCNPHIYTANLPGFITFANGILTIKPISTDSIGIHKLSISLVESCPYQMTNTFLVNVEVTAKVISSSSSETKTSSSSSLIVKQSEASSSVSNQAGLNSSFEQNYSGSWKAPVKTLPKDQINLEFTIDIGNTSATLQAYIYKITPVGKATIKFTEPIQVINNFKEINGYYLDLNYIKNEANNSTLLGWIPIEFRSTGFDLQLNFSNPNQVSNDVNR